MRAAAPTGMNRWLSGLLLAAAAHAAEPAVFSSGPEQVRLVELYTSEGCSSCPPAEAWLGSLRDEPGLWRDFVPVAFHVAYWDRLGWKDRWASRAFTERQYLYSERWGSSSVYTPCFVLDGQEWRHRRPPGRGPSAGRLEAVVTGGRCRVAFAGGTPADQVTVALLGGGITSPVRRGENAGRTLRHEFVALGLASAPLVNGAAELMLPPVDPAGVGRRALAVWVSRAGAPLQAAGGWLD